jgi:hypothetical protein
MMMVMRMVMRMISRYWNLAAYGLREIFEIQNNNSTPYGVGILYQYILTLLVLMSKRGQRQRGAGASKIQKSRFHVLAGTRVLLATFTERASFVLRDVLIITHHPSDTSKSLMLSHCFISMPLATHYQPLRRHH